MEAPDQPRAELDPVVLARLRDSRPPLDGPSRGSTPASRRSTRTCSCRSSSASAPWPPAWPGSSSMSLGAPLHRCSSAAGSRADAHLASRGRPCRLDTCARRRPQRISWRKWLIGFGVALVVAVTAAGSIDWLGDAIQTRPDTLREDVFTRSRSSSRRRPKAGPSRPRRRCGAPAATSCAADTGDRQPARRRSRVDRAPERPWTACRAASPGLPGGRGGRPGSGRS